MVYLLFITLHFIRLGLKYGNQLSFGNKSVFKCG